MALTNEQRRAMEAAERFGGLSQRGGGSSWSVEMFAGLDGAATMQAPSFTYSTVASLVRRGLLKWASHRHGRFGHWSAVVAKES